MIHEVENKLYAITKDTLTSITIADDNNEFNYRKNFQLLSLIAQDETIKKLNNSELSKLAGEIAISLSSRRQDRFSDLLSIGNNKNIDRSINLKAYIKIAEAALSEKEKYINELKMIADAYDKSWINDALSEKRNSLSEQDIELLNRLNSFLHNAKTN